MNKLRNTLTLQFVVNSNVELDNTGQERYSFNEKQMGDFINGVVKNLALSDVVRCVCKIPEPRLKVSENGTYAYCEKCAKTYVQI